MTSKVYLSPHVSEFLNRLDFSNDQVDNLVNAIDSLGQEDPRNSPVVFADDTPGGGLRELDRNNLRILFRYDPQQQSIMVAEVLPVGRETTRQNDLAASV